ncbi:NAD(P)-dependent oxidoreductase [Acuticoccus sediminis]|uniref:NAD(P)-dependent oxidoreductase n=1 Tax=Acuticoccus sediminis TaxID=2184697 RepID=UPI001CFCA870|nr:NAD(P)-binding domain-containing protein [Acuticoccus sediminis]
MTEPVAVYGLGNMGFVQAERIARAFPTLVFDLSPERLAAAATAFGAKAIKSAADVAQCRFVVLCLPHPDASRAVLRELRPHLRSDAIVIETSTVNPDDVREFAGVLEGVGAELIDASILAGVSQMEAGTATLLLGGDEALIAAAGPVLDAIAVRQKHFGALGAGAAAKVINNAVAHAVMVVVAEAGSMAMANDVEIDKLIGLLSDPEMGLHRPLTFRYAKRVLGDDYEGGMPLLAARKDSELAQTLAHRSGVPLFAIQACHSVYELGVAAGYADEDYAAIAKLWRDWGKPAAPSPKPS